MGSRSGALLRAVMLVCLAVGLSTAFNCTQKHFAEFRAQYNRHYATPEEAAHRFAVFCDNMAHADQLNQRYPTARFGSTKFADLTTEEFRRDYLGVRVPKDLAFPAPAAAPAPPPPPTSFDWRNYSRVVLTPVKNQLQCGSCWAFSATELIETMWALAGNQLQELSPQQIVDCDISEYGHGCTGGWPFDAINYVKAVGGLDLEAYYPYMGAQGQCRFNPNYVGADVGGCANAGAENETVMAAYLASTGPLSVIVDATSWNYYQGGILPAATCGTSLDHAVVAVGYDMQAGYWAIRNSWGANWGEAGYIYIQFGENACGLSQYPIVASG